MKFNKWYFGIFLIACLTFIVLKSPKKAVTFTGGSYSYAFNRLDIIYHKVFFAPCKLFIEEFTFCEDHSFVLEGCSPEDKKGNWKQSSDTLYLTYERETCLWPPFLIIDGDILRGNSVCPEFRTFYKQRLNKI
ncbi:MAG: hypothetical protein IPI60_18965 [Saprospiraceae bacterium]|nr:hypothetical protein [Saprospiraceae bacterium]